MVIIPGFIPNLKLCSAVYYIMQNNCTYIVYPTAWEEDYLFCLVQGKKFQNAISNIGNYNKGQLPILKIKVCIRIVAYYNSCSWNENDKNWQCTVQNQWCPTAFQCVYSRTISSLLIFLRHAALYLQRLSKMLYIGHWRNQNMLK